MKKIVVVKPKRKTVKIVRAKKKPEPQIAASNGNGLPMKPIREQAIGIKEKNFQEIRATIQTALNERIDVTLGPDTINQLNHWNGQLWDVAEQTARNGVSDEELKQFEPEFWAMVVWCKDQLRHSQVITRVSDLNEIFWPYPRVIDSAEQTKSRRDEVVERVREYWHKALIHYRDKGFEVDVCSKSYRTVLAAKNLCDAVEKYAINWRTVGQTNHLDDDTVMEMVKQAARRYLNAHLPIDKNELGRGPVDDLDPNFIEYMRTCKYWNIKPGEYLHTYFKGYKG